MKITIEHIAGVDAMTDQVIATDFLLYAKSGIRNYAQALSETATEEVRKVLKDQLNQAINTHEKISKFMIDKGWYQAHDINKQLQLNLDNAKTAIDIETEEGNKKDKDSK